MFDLARALPLHRQAKTASTMPRSLAVGKLLSWAPSPQAFLQSSQVMQGVAASRVIPCQTPHSRPLEMALPLEMARPLEMGRPLEMAPLRRSVVAVAVRA